MKRNKIIGWMNEKNTLKKWKKRRFCGVINGEGKGDGQRYGRRGLEGFARSVGWAQYSVLLKE